MFFSQIMFAAAVYFYLKNWHTEQENWRTEQETQFSKRHELCRKRISRARTENRALSAKVSALENMPRPGEANHTGLTANPRNNMENRYEAEILNKKSPVTKIVRVDEELRIAE